MRCISQKRLSKSGQGDCRELNDLMIEGLSEIERFEDFEIERFGGIEDWEIRGLRD